MYLGSWFLVGLLYSFLSSEDFLVVKKMGSVLKFMWCLVVGLEFWGGVGGRE